MCDEERFDTDLLDDEFECFDFNIEDDFTLFDEDEAGDIPTGENVFIDPNDPLVTRYCQLPQNSFVRVIRSAVSPEFFLVSDLGVVGAVTNAEAMEAFNGKRLTFAHYNDMSTFMNTMVDNVVAEERLRRRHQLSTVAACSALAAGAILLANAFFNRRR